MKDSSLIKKLQGIGFLRGIHPAHLEQIASISEVCEYDTEEILFHEGGEAGYVYFVVTGKIILELCRSTIYQKNPVRISGSLSQIARKCFPSIRISCVGATTTPVDACLGSEFKWNRRG